MRPTPLLALAALSLGALAGCDPATAKVGRDGPVTGDVEIEVVGRSELVVGAWAQPENHLVVGKTDFSSYLTLGLGEDYPAELTVEVGGVWQSRCALEGTWSADSLEVGDEAVVEAKLKGDTIALDVRGAGETEIIMTGTFDGGCTWFPEAIGAWDVTFTIEVAVVEPVSAVLEGQPYSCANTEEPVVVQGGPLNQGFQVLPADADGTGFHLDNAEPTRQVAYALRLPDGASATLPPMEAGLTGLVIDGAPGEVSLVAASGEFAVLEVAAPSEVEAAEMAFVVPWGAMGTNYVVGSEPGLVWADLYVASDVRQVIPAVGKMTVRGRESCSGADPDWFTATVDPDEPLLEDADSTLPSHQPVHPGWEITSWGEYSFTLEAPELAGGAGLSHQVDVVMR